jgi:hypothetical protein
MEAIKKIYLEKSKFDREYVHPFIREVQNADTIEFEAVDAEFIVSISNKDKFLTNTDGTHPGDNLVFTLIDTGGTKTQQYKIASAADVPYKYYNVCWNDIYADRPGNSPPKIIAVP